MTRARSIQDVRWESCPAMLSALDALDEMRKRTGAPQLERMYVRDLGHLIVFGDEELPEVYQSPAANLEFVCEGEYPDDPLDTAPVTFQTRFESDQGFQLGVFLHGSCAPSKDARRSLLESDALGRLVPRRGVEDFLERESCPPLVTNWISEDEFREAVCDAARLFILHE